MEETGQTVVTHVVWALTAPERGTYDKYSMIAWTFLSVISDRSLSNKLGGGDLNLSTQHSRLKKSPLATDIVSEWMSEVTCGQVWWPILRICALHLTHPSAHTNSSEHTHTHREHTPGAVGGSVPCSRVWPQSWYWRRRRALVIHSPHRQFLPDLRLEPATFGLQVRLSNH